MSRGDRCGAGAVPALALLCVATAAAGCVPAPSPDSGGAITTGDGGEAMTDEADPATGSAGTLAREGAAAAPGTLRVSVHAVVPRSATDRPLELVVRANNDSARAATLLLWNTPFERTLSADVFRVTHDGEPVTYRGRLVKRAPPPGEDALVRLAPGEAFERTLDLADAYAVDAPGTYSIEFVPRPVMVGAGTDGGAGGGGGHATLVAGDAGPVVVERR